MKIDSLGIIGGTHGIGQTFAQFFEQKFAGQKKVLVSGRQTKLTNQELVRQCDIVLFSVPIAVTQQVIAECCAVSRADQIWADFTSIKQQPVEAMLASSAQVCGLHPMFGPGTSPPGQKLIMTPARITPEYQKLLEQCFEDMEIIQATPEEHDEIMAVVQGLSHFSDFVLGATLQESGLDRKKIQAFSSAPYLLKFDVLGRMFHQNPELYAQIAVANPENKKLLKHFSRVFTRLQSLVEAEKSADLASVFRSVRSFLSEDFCGEAFCRSQDIIDSFYKHSSECLGGDQATEGIIFGGKDSHTDQASWDFAVRTKETSIQYARSVFEVFEAVSSGAAQWGIVPYENSTQGSVFETLDELFDREEMLITDAREKTIHQHLVGLPGAHLDEGLTVLSHPQALAQSKEWLRENLPQARWQVASSTAEAAKRIKQQGQKTQMAIASDVLAEHLGLDILAASIEAHENTTRFVKIERKKLPQDRSFLSLAFWFTEDKPGNLAQALQFFADHKINLMKLDSRRATKAFGRYVFFVDAQVSGAAFSSLEPLFVARVGGFKILGSFN